MISEEIPDAVAEDLRDKVDQAVNGPHWGFRVKNALGEFKLAGSFETEHETRNVAAYLQIFFGKCAVVPYSKLHGFGTVMRGIPNGAATIYWEDGTREAVDG